jgi:hypothetical protein
VVEIRNEKLPNKSTDCYRYENLPRDQVKDEMGSACSTSGTGVKRIPLMGKRVRKIPVARLRYRLEDNIKIGFKETGISVWTRTNQLR